MENALALLLLPVVLGTAAMGTPELPPPNRRMIALGDLRVLPDEIICDFLSALPVKEVMNLACVSSVFYILCMEEPLWMKLCLQDSEGMLQYEGSWRQTMISRLARSKGIEPPKLKPLRQFQGFSSMFLYRRWYRCHVKLEAFAADNGVVERKAGLSCDQFATQYDGKKPVILTDLTEDWAPLSTWSREQLLEVYGDVLFKVSQYHGKKSKMTLRDYFSYMDLQCDEEPLYIFDEKFGESAPGMLQSYKVPVYFEEDFLTLLGEKRRPSFRWFLVGPARSGASWHVDPALTAAWNTLLCGRKRWAMYPPGRVPPAVTVHVDEDTGEVNYDTPTSLQWWMDVYPGLDPGDKPIECTQLPGETISVPTGWWHCVLNLEETVAVTQNFVNSSNLEIVLLDMTPGYRHRGIARAGELAIREEAKRLAQEKELGTPASGNRKTKAGKNGQTLTGTVQSATTSATGERKSDRPEHGLKRQRLRMEADADVDADVDADAEADLDDDVSVPSGLEGEWTSMKREEYLGEGWLSLIARVIAEDQVDVAHFVERMSDNGYMRAKDTRRWIRNLWLSRPDLAGRIWKCASIMFGADRWLERVNRICRAHGLREPEGVEQLPFGGGTNPVYVIGDAVIKVYVNCDSDRTPVDCINRELELYSLLLSTSSTLLKMIPPLIGCGILLPSADGSPECQALPSDTSAINIHVGTPPPAEQAATWRGHRSATPGHNGLSAQAGALPEQEGSGVEEDREDATNQWPYLITKRCEGKELGRLECSPTEGDAEEVTTFVGDALRCLHSLPLPAAVTRAGGEVGTSSPPRGNQVLLNGVAGEGANGTGKESNKAKGQDALTTAEEGFSVPAEWELFVKKMRRQRREATDRLRAWETLPEALLKQVDSYLPQDPAVLAGLFPGCDLPEHAHTTPRPVWLHTDIHDDNILCHLVPSKTHTNGNGTAPLLTELPTRASSLAESPSPQPAGGPDGTKVLARIWEDKVAQDPKGREGKETNGGSAAHEVLSCSKELSATGVRLRYLLDFGDVLFGDALYDFVAMHTGIFNGNPLLLTAFLRRYSLPLRIPASALAAVTSHASSLPTKSASPSPKGPPCPQGVKGDPDCSSLVLQESSESENGTSLASRLERASYRALCYCLLHEQDFTGSLFNKAKHLRTLRTLEEVEMATWGPLNDV